MRGNDTFVVVGGGLAAAKAAEGLRSSGFGGRLVVLTEETHLPYERPPLSKGYLLGTDTFDSAFVHAPQWYEDHDVELHLAARVTAIDPTGHIVTAKDAQIGYDTLLVATGSRPRRLPVAIDSAVPVTYLRTIADSYRVKTALQPGARIIVVGGGWIGLEVAAAARTAGAEVVLVEALRQPLGKTLGPEVAEVITKLHEAKGVDLRTSTAVSSIGLHDGTASARLDDGSTVVGDLVIAGVGVTPNCEPAQDAGLKTDNGIVVDEYLRTSHPDIFAAGDVANAYHPRLGRHMRVEHWDNAMEQGLTAARNMLGASEAYERLPYFFTDQYDLGMEYFGNVGPAGYDELVLRGDVAGRTFTAFWLADGEVLAGMHANDWDAADVVRRIVYARAIDAEALRDAGVPLDEVADSRRRR